MAVCLLLAVLNMRIGKILIGLGLKEIHYDLARERLGLPKSAPLSIKSN